MEGLGKGIFANIILKYLRENHHEPVIEKVSKMLGKPLKYIDFFDYPIPEFMILIEEIAKEVFPHKTLEDACYELGRISINKVLDIPVAKVAIAYARKNIHGAVKNVPLYFSQFARMGEVAVSQPNQNSYEVRFKEWQGYPHYTYAMLVFSVKEIDPNMKLKLEVRDVKILGKGKVISDFSCILELPKDKE
ncbi:MAG: DUF2378 family protein [Candidatus Omnitrophota bacterium]